MNIEPINVFRVAVMKNASRVIMVHNHPSGSLTPSEADKDITDRLIQVGRILNIDLVDHLIITPTTYISFRSIKLMEELEQSLKYVPTFQVIERIRKEEKQIAKEKLAVERGKTKTAQQKAKTEKEQKEAAIGQAIALANALFKKGVDIETIANIMEVRPEKVERIVKK